MSLGNRELYTLIESHRSILIKIYDSSIEISKLDLDSDYVLLDQILEMREALFNELSSLYAKIEMIKEGVGQEEFLSAYKENDRYIDMILEMDNRNRNSIEKFGKMLNSEKLYLMNKKKAVGNYKISDIKKSKFFDRIS
ncbi:MAG: hypothetical protein CR982_01195 [Candidatus Cloacimonadota bacterium]|nr:MAG: hypothetical protein CR982_01195 [Candidatus Cloacimonadota bacterium]PIE81260.1 MAG: hypothetical protein CSA15_00975 [Candidatus Delongbacteria bacterium]